MRCRSIVTIIACCSPAAVLAGGIQVPEKALSPVIVEGSLAGQIGSAESANQGMVTARQLENRPLSRAGEMLETVPGVIVTQHSEDGKANQFFLRGFNLDHGTDFRTTVMRDGRYSAYSGERDRRFRSIVTAAQRSVLRG